MTRLLSFVRACVARGLAFLNGFFFDRVASKPSMVRLLAFLFAVNASTVAAVACVVALAGGVNAAPILHELALILGALVASGSVALLTRAKGAAPDAVARTDEVKG